MKKIISINSALLSLFLISCEKKDNPPDNTYFCNIKGAISEKDTCYCPPGQYNFPNRICQELDSMDFVAVLPNDKFTWNKLILSFKDFTGSNQRTVVAFADNDNEDLTLACDYFKRTMEGDSMVLQGLTDRNYKSSNGKNLEGIIVGVFTSVDTIQAHLKMYDKANSNLEDSILIVFHK